MIIKRSKEESGLDKAIASVLDEMNNVNADSDEYDKMSTQLDRLYKLKEIDAPRRVSPDTVALIVGNLSVALIVVAYESKNVLTSKVGTFLLKLR